MSSVLWGPWGTSGTLKERNKPELERMFHMVGTTADKVHLLGPIILADGSNNLPSLPGLMGLTVIELGKMVAKITQSYAMKSFKPAPWIGGGSKLAANATHRAEVLRTHIIARIAAFCTSWNFQISSRAAPYWTVVQSGGDLRYKCLWAEFPNPGMGSTDIQHEVMQKPSQTWVNVTYSSRI